MTTYEQSSIFDSEKYEPLADRMRPRNLSEFEGQEHILGEGRILRKLIVNDSITSMILWGPPGVGKTTLAKIIANMTNSKFVSFSAVVSGIKEIKNIMDEAESQRRFGNRTLLFVDEIHRFNKAQQDAFLPYVERGDIILIGATTENPSFEINSALLSRSKVFVLKALTEKNIVNILIRTIRDKDRGYGNINIQFEDGQLYKIAAFSGGDARIALNTLEMAISGMTPDGDKPVILTDEIIEDAMQKKTLLYDKKGEEHYNLISALHKSMRNSDSDAAVYWLARMLESGEDPLYIARRVIRFASEDVGLADPRALEIAVAAYNASHYIGMPECSVNLAQAVIYMAMAPKSNALYAAYNKAKDDAVKTMAEGVPLHLRNAPTSLMSEIGYGKGYKYAHDFKNKIADMECLPENLIGRVYYNPTEQGLEKNFKLRKEQLNKLKKKDADE